jgi:hypothetical protein
MQVKELLAYYERYSLPSELEFYNFEFYNVVNFQLTQGVLAILATDKPHYLGVLSSHETKVVSSYHRKIYNNIIDSISLIPEICCVDVPHRSKTW